MSRPDARRNRMGKPEGEVPDGFKPSLIAIDGPLPPLARLRGFEAQKIIFVT